mgnify:FL=1
MKDFGASESNVSPSDIHKKRDKRTERKTLKWILSVARPEIPTVLFIIFGEGLWAVFGTVTALFSREIINGATRGDRDHMFLFLIIYLVVALSLLAVHGIMNYTTERCKGRLEILFRSRVFDKMLSRRYAELREHHTGDLVNRLSGDVGVISDAAATIIPNVVMMSVRLICAMIVLIRLNWRFALVFSIGGVLIFLFARLFKGMVQEYHKAMQQADGRTRSFWQEIFENLMVVKSFAGEQKAEEKASALMNEHYKLRMKRSLIGTFSMVGTRVVVRMGHLFAIGYGAYCLLSGTMDFGTLTALNQLVGQVQQPFANMTGIMPRYYSALSSAERLMEIENLPEDTVGTPVNAAETYRKMQNIDVQDITFRYDEDKTVLENCSCVIQKGDFVSITGMSGIGKSTLFKVLLDIYPFEAGEAVLCTSEGRLPLTGSTRTLFAYVPQGNMLFSGSLRDNLLFMAHENVSDEQIRKALECACAAEFVDALPEKLDTVIGENGVGLSEGQIQRLSFARALLSEAPILLLDEATSALDEATEAKLLTNLKALDNRTCIIVTHKKAALAVCNRHFVIKDKKIVEPENGLVGEVRV